MSMNCRKITFGFSLFLVTIFICVCIIKNVTGITSTYKYCTFEISDWLINYQGGFVRRGLIGEILHVFYTIIPFSVKTAINIIICTTFIITFFLIQKASTYLKVGIFPFLTVFCSNLIDLGWYRRDFLVLIIAYYVILLHIKVLKKRYVGTCFLVSQFLMALLLLVHEASFFFVFPILFLVTWFSNSSDLINKQKIVSCLKFFMLPFVTMAIICIMKGNRDIASSVWQSWNDLFVMFPEERMPYMGEGVRWLTCDTKEVALLHLDMNFQTHSGLLGVAKCFLLLSVTLFFTYFITLRNLYVDISKKRLTISSNNSSIANILLLQFIFMIPMLTFLSTDYPRTIMYCVVTSVFVVYSMKRHNVEIYCPKRCLNISLCINQYINKSRLLRNPWVFFIFIICYPISFFGCISLPGNILIYKYLSYIKQLIIG